MTVTTWRSAGFIAVPLWGADSSHQQSVRWCQCFEDCDLVGEEHRLLAEVSRLLGCQLGNELPHKVTNATCGVSHHLLQLSEFRVFVCHTDTNGEDGKPSSYSFSRSCAGDRLKLNIYLPLRRWRDRSEEHSSELQSR